MREEFNAIFKNLSRWSCEKPVPRSHIIAAALAMGIPMAIGAAVNQIEIGILASLGGLALSGASGNGTYRQQFVLLSAALFASSIAILFGTSMGSQNWVSVIVTICTIFIVALLGNLSRLMARSSGIFMAFFLMGVGLASSHQVDPLSVTFIFILGALWALFIFIIMSFSFRSTDLEKSTSNPSDEKMTGKRRKPTTRERILFWLRSLKTLKGWAFTLRLSVCMITAELMAFIMNQPTSYWIPLVVVLVVHRDHGTTLDRSSQRAIGTIAGVALGSVLLFCYYSKWILIVLVSLLSASRPLLKERNYALYSMVMTPLVITILGLGVNTSSAVLVYRLIDTIIGALIAIIFGYLIWKPIYAKSK